MSSPYNPGPVGRRYGYDASMSEVSALPVLTGLSAAEVAERVNAGRTNDVPSTSSRSIGSIARENILTWFNGLLGGLAVVILIIGSPKDALFGIVVIANATIGIVQEVRAKRTLDQLAVLTTPKARVLRDGSVTEVATNEVVLDDLLVLRAGDQIVVDGTVVDTVGLELDESLLTGEADPVLKPPGAEALSGSFVAAGSGHYKATKVGRDAYAAKLAEDAKRFTLVRSELRSGINKLLRVITFALIPAAALLTWSQLHAHESIEEALSGAIAGTVAMVPEGLVLLTSIAFAVGVVRLAKHRVLVQELAAIEVLSRVDVLCIDKTGTLTEGRLDVDRVESLADGADLANAALAAMAAAEVSPNATLAAVAEAYPAAPDDWHVTGSVPFSSARKWSGVSFDGHGGWLLGGPDVLAPALADSTIAASTGARCEALAAEGWRVLLLTRSAEVLTEEHLPSDLAPEAIVVLGDRVRTNAPDTLAYFGEQGVVVKVISGDHPATVSAVAARAGVPDADQVVDARDLPEDAEALAELMEAHAVFGRVTPQQKRAMVHALQSRGHVVAMTGDGVNDVLALKDSDIGVAMGSGSAATRAVAQLVLLDSDFAALPPVVAEGRRVLGNIERTSNLYVTKSMYAWLLAVGIGLFAFPFPFLPRHLTLVGMLTIGIPSFFLALEANTDRALPGFLRRVVRFAVPTGIATALATFMAYALITEQPGIGLREAQTTATMVLGFIGLLVLGIVAKPLRRNRLLLIWTMAFLFVAAIVLPATRTFFALDPPPAIDWLASFGIASLVWWVAKWLIPARLGPPTDPAAPGGSA